MDRYLSFIQKQRKPAKITCSFIRAGQFGSEELVLFASRAKFHLLFTPPDPFSLRDKHTYLTMTTRHLRILLFKPVTIIFKP